MAKKNLAFLFSLPSNRPISSRFFAFLIGSAMTLVFAPAEFYLLAPFLISPLLFVALTTSPKETASHFFYFGLGLFIAGTYWIYISVHVYGNAAPWVAIILMVALSLLMASFMWLSGWLISKLSCGKPWHILFIGPSVWVLVEWLRGWAFTGFPWLSQGYGQIDSALSGWAPIFGVYGVSMMVLFSSAAILLSIMMRGKERIAAISIIFLPWALGSILKSVEWTEAHGKPIRATVIQAGISQDKKWLPSQRQSILSFYRDTTLNMADSDIIVWPEVAIPSLQDKNINYLNTINYNAKLNNQTVLVGILERETKNNAHPKIYNSVMSLGTDEYQVYRKRHLVPFGEYFPVPAFVREWMKLKNLPYSDLSSGIDNQPLLKTSNGLNLSIAICWEDAFGVEQLYALPVADFLVNVSNDAWFGDSIAPHQHLQIARMRALEVGRYSIRSTNTGISAFIDPIGDLIKTGKQFEPVVMSTDIYSHRGNTLYASFGNWMILGICSLILSFFSFDTIKKIIHLLTTVIMFN
ncbi:MAG: apolipoprotein N-acyltransferase [Gammaproteobacteria bacterium]|mgnify:CR=1 FL=1|nr:apolipoprotein N-acyltransferase [Gammaproteobacteria bacterium]